MSTSIQLVVEPGPAVFLLTISGEGDIGYSLGVLRFGARDRSVSDPRQIGERLGCDAGATDGIVCAVACERIHETVRWSSAHRPTCL